jgi:hypothetical protein
MKCLLERIEKSKQRMSKQEPSKSSSPGNSKGSMIANRYYVQHLTEQIFLVRERLSANGMPGADDRIVHSFSTLHDAHAYASSLNDA